MPLHHRVQCASTVGRVTACQSSRTNRTPRTAAPLRLDIESSQTLWGASWKCEGSTQCAAHCCESLRGVLCRTIHWGSPDADKRAGQAWVEGQTQLAGKAVRISVQLSLGGAAFGVAVGVIITSWLRTMFDNRMAEITLTVRFFFYGNDKRIYNFQRRLHRSNLIVKFTPPPG